MKRAAIWVVLALWAVALAPRPALAPPPVHLLRVRQFQRNFPVIQSLVEGSLRLAREEDPLRRAQCCTEVLEGLAGSLEQAVAQADRPRIVELSYELDLLLKEAVATNLERACGAEPRGPARAKDLLAVGRRVAEILLPLEGRIGRFEGSEETDSAVHYLKEGRVAVEKGLEGLGDQRFP